MINIWDHLFELLKYKYTIEPLIEPQNPYQNMEPKYLANIVSTNFGLGSEPDPRFVETFEELMVHMLPSLKEMNCLTVLNRLILNLSITIHYCKSLGI